MRLVVEESARKHGFTDVEITYAILHYADKTAIKGKANQPTFAFTRPRHQGDLEENFLDVYAALWRDGDIHAFHALTHANSL